LPRLLLFVPCERVLLNQGDNNISLITVLEEIGVSLPAPEKVPPDSRIPANWQILVVWLWEPSEAGKRFEMVCTLVLPDGSSLTPFRAFMERAGRTHRQIVTLRHFPLSKVPGEYVLGLSLREDIEGAPLHKVAEYPFLFKHDPT